MIILYHSTTPTAAQSILAGGFRDFPWGGSGLSGVWFGRDLGNDGAGDTVLEVVLDITEDELADFAVIEDERLDQNTGEWIKDPGSKPYEWFLPAELIRTKGRIRLLTDDEVEDLTAAAFDRRIIYPLTDEGGER